MQLNDACRSRRRPGASVLFRVWKRRRLTLAADKSERTPETPATPATPRPAQNSNKKQKKEEESSKEEKQTSTASRNSCTGGDLLCHWNTNNPARIPFSLPASILVFILISLKKKNRGSRIPFLISPDQISRKIPLNLGESLKILKIPAQSLPPSERESMPATRTQTDTKTQIGFIFPLFLRTQMRKGSC